MPTAIKLLLILMAINLGKLSPEWIVNTGFCKYKGNGGLWCEGLVKAMNGAVGKEGKATVGSALG